MQLPYLLGSDDLKRDASIARKVSQKFLVCALICHSPARGLYELHMGWGLRNRASHPQPERGYCDGGRDLN